VPARTPPHASASAARSPGQRLVVLVHVLAETFRHLPRATEQQPRLRIAGKLATKPVLELLHAVYNRGLQQRQLLGRTVDAGIIEPAQILDHLVQVRDIETFPGQLLAQLPRLLQPLTHLAAELPHLVGGQRTGSCVGAATRTVGCATRDATLLPLPTAGLALLLLLTLAALLALLTLLALALLALLTLTLLALLALTLLALLALALALLTLLALTLLALLALALALLTLLALALLALLALTLLALLALALLTLLALTLLALLALTLLALLTLTLLVGQ
jgi:hypothetical protein